jgi:hypothetical protein
MAKRTKTPIAPVEVAVETPAPSGFQGVTDLLLHFTDTIATLKAGPAGDLGLNDSELGLILKHLSDINFILHVAMKRN